MDPERQVREVAQVGEHPVDVVGRDAAQQQRADAELLEAPRAASEGVALRAAPVLPVDAAQAVAAAAERQPHRQPDGHERRDGRVERRAHDREALDHQDVRRLVGHRAVEQADGLGRVGAVDVGVQRERDGDLALAALLGDGLAAQPHAAPGDRHPARGAAAAVGRREEPARVGGHDVASGADEAAVVGDHVARRPGLRAGGPAVEDHAALGGERFEQRVVGRSHA
jgi:hypothetical protein